VTTVRVPGTIAMSSAISGTPTAIGANLGALGKVGERVEPLTG
jgi:hypothetical protein